MDSVIWIVIALVAGRMLQLWLTYKQSMAFNDDVRRLRRSGAVSVGLGGKRYRGGRAFVAIAVDERGVVRDAMTLQGLTTFARGKALPALSGVRVNKLAGEGDVAGLTKPQRLAAAQAAQLYRDGTGRGRATTPPTSTASLATQKEATV